MRDASSAVARACRPASALRPAPSQAPARHRRLRGRGSWRCADDSAPRATAPRASNRASRSGSLAKLGGRTLIATSRPSLVSRARYTSPMPPVPSGPTISKEPSFVPTARLTLRPEDSDTTAAVDVAKKALRPSPFSHLTPHRAACLLAALIFCLLECVFRSSEDRTSATPSKTAATPANHGRSDRSLRARHGRVRHRCISCASFQRLAERSRSQDFQRSSAP